MSNKKEEARAWRGLLLISVGLLITLVPIYGLVEGYTAWAVFTVGFGFLGFGMAEVSIYLWRMEQKRLRLINWHRRHMKQANKGVVWVWVVGLAGICVYAIAFYVLLYPTLELIGIVEGLVSWDADAAFTLNFCRTVLNWHPIIFIVGLLIWAFVNSQRREDVTYPAY